MIHAVSCWRRSSFSSLIEMPSLAAEVRIDPVLLGPHRDAGIEHDEPEPACVEREVLHRPPVTGRHLRVVQRVRQHPLGGPLEDRELLDLVGDGRRDLEAGGAGADEREPLAREVEPVGPACRVERRAGERVHAGEIVVSANPWSFSGGENGDIYLVSDGSSPRRIIGADGDDVAQACPRFSPDGGTLAYGEGRATGTVSTHRGGWTVGDRTIVVVGMNERGDPSPPRVRVALPAGQGPMACPEWSPMGRHVAFRVGGAIWIVDSISGAIRVLPDVSIIGREDNELEWSRDGSMIAVAEPGQIRIMHVDGGPPTIIEVEGGPPRSLGWTAGDGRIVYVSVVPVDGYGSAIHVVDIDGANDTRLTPVETTPGAHFTFDEAAVSPDGTRVAYLQGVTQCTTDGCGSAPAQNPLVIENLDSSTRVDVPAPADLVASPRWSPDGRRLLLSSIAGVSSVGLDGDSPAIVYANGNVGTGLNLEWSASEVSWQPVTR